jgi:CRP-like cAMP-binding protein
VPPPLTHTLVRALQQVPAFASLNEGTLLTIVGASANLFWPAGASVFEAGDPADALYIVLSGSVRIVEETEGEGAREVARIRAGDFFGELSLLLERQHSKRAEAVEDSELMVLCNDPLRALLDASPELAGHVRRTMEDRLASPQRR